MNIVVTGWLAGCCNVLWKSSHHSLLLGAEIWIKYYWRISDCSARKYYYHFQTNTRHLALAKEHSPVHTLHSQSPPALFRLKIISRFYIFSHEMFSLKSLWWKAWLYDKIRRWVFSSIGKYFVRRKLKLIQSEENMKISLQSVSPWKWYYIFSEWARSRIINIFHLVADSSGDSRILFVVTSWRYYSQCSGSGLEII